MFDRVNVIVNNTVNVNICRDRVRQAAKNNSIKNCKPRTDSLTFDERVSAQYVKQARMNKLNDSIRL